MLFKNVVKSFLFGALLFSTVALADTFSNYTTGAPLLDTDLFVVSKNGTGTRKITGSEVNTYILAENPTLTAFEAYNTAGLITQTAADTFTGRTVTGTSNAITVTNGNGVSGNPTLNLSTTLDLSSKTVRVPSSTALPGTCTTGDMYMDTDATTGQRFYLCESTNTWAVQGDGVPGAITHYIPIAVSDEVSSLTTGTAKITFRMPAAMTLTGVRASVTTAPTGSTIIVDINETGTTILSTKLSIDVSEKTSTTAASAAVISDSALASDAVITIDIDQKGSTIAGAGLKIWLIGTM